MSVKISVSKLFTKAAADGKITKKEAQQIAKAVQKGGVTKNEQAALKANLARHTDSFQSGARAPLNKLTGASASTSTPGTGLTPDQRKLLADAGVRPGSPEYKVMVAQMLMSNAAKSGPLSSAQLNKLLADAGVDPNSAEARQIKAQHAMSTSQAVQGSPAGSGDASSIVGSIAGAVPNGYGLTESQKQIFKNANVDPDSEEGKSMKLQMMMANYKNNMEMVSNISKMLTELSSSIIRNIRA